MKIDESKKIVIDTKTDSNKSIKVIAVICCAILFVAAGVLINVFSSNSEIEIPVAQTTVTDTASTKEYNFPKMEATSATTTIPQETTTSVSVNADGTTIYIQTNTPPIETTSVPQTPSEEVVGIYPEDEVDKVLESLQAEVTSTAQTTTQAVQTTTAAKPTATTTLASWDKPSYTDLNGDLWVYSIISGQYYNYSEQQRYDAANSGTFGEGNGVKVFD